MIAIFQYAFYPKHLKLVIHVHVQVVEIRFFPETDYYKTCFIYEDKPCVHGEHVEHRPLIQVSGDDLP